MVIEFMRYYGDKLGEWSFNICSVVYELLI